MLEDRITELEIKFSHQDHLVDELNKIISIKFYIFIINI